jgi:hypothetical protein
MLAVLSTTNSTSTAPPLGIGPVVPLLLSSLELIDSLELLDSLDELVSTPDALVSTPDELDPSADSDDDSPTVIVPDDEPDSSAVAFPVSSPHAPTSATIPNPYQPNQRPTMPKAYEHGPAVSSKPASGPSQVAG